MKRILTSTICMVLGTIIGVILNIYIIIPTLHPRPEVKDTTDKAVVLANLSINKKIPLKEFWEVLNNSLSGDYGVYKSLEIPSLKSKYSVLAYTSTRCNNGLDEFLEKIQNKNYVVIRDNINKGARPSNNLRCCLNQSSIETLFDNEEKLMIFPYNSDNGEFMGSIFNVLNNLKGYTDITEFFNAVKKDYGKEILFVINDETGKTLSEIDTLRNQKLNDFSKDLEQILETKSEKKRSELVSLMEANYPECAVEYARWDHYNASETYSIKGFVNYYFSDLAPGNKETFTNPIPRNDKCKYNITYAKLERFVIETGVLNSQWSN